MQRLWFLLEGLRRQQLICCLWMPPLTQKHMKELVSHQASTPTHWDRPPPEPFDLWAPFQSFSAQCQHAYLLCINPPRHHAGACANSVGVEDTVSLPFLIALIGSVAVCVQLCQLMQGATSAACQTREPGASLAGWTTRWTPNKLHSWRCSRPQQM